MVDTGLPRSRDSLQSALAALGRSAADIEAVVLTHDATTALTGHGPPWKGSLGEAVERARAAGAA